MRRTYLLGTRISWCGEAIILTIHGRASTSSDCVHSPLKVVVVHHMNVSPPDPRHPLHEPLSELVQSYRHLFHHRHKFRSRIKESKIETPSFV